MGNKLNIATLAQGSMVTISDLHHQVGIVEVVAVYFDEVVYSVRPITGYLYTRVASDLGRATPEQAEQFCTDLLYLAGAHPELELQAAADLVQAHGEARDMDSEMCDYCASTATVVHWATRFSAQDVGNTCDLHAPRVEALRASTVGTIAPEVLTAGMVRADVAHYRNENARPVKLTPAERRHILAAIAIREQQGRDFADLVGVARKAVSSTVVKRMEGKGLLEPTFPWPGRLTPLAYRSVGREDLAAEDAQWDAFWARHGKPSRNVGALDACIENDHAEAHQLNGTVAERHDGPGTDRRLWLYGGVKAPEAPRLAPGEAEQIEGWWQGRTV